MVLIHRGFLLLSVEGEGIKKIAGFINLLTPTLSLQDKLYMG
jgi:hypothetical protein